MHDRPMPSAMLSFGDFRIDQADERLIGPAGPVKIGNKAYRLLLLLIGEQGRLVTKDTIFDVVWENRLVSEAALTSVTKELRRALGDDPREPRYIETVYGRGYRMRSPVSASVPEQQAAAPTAALQPVESAAGPPLVLVSSFDDRAVAQTVPHCAAELREEILTGLSRVREIRLVADEGNASPTATGSDSRAYQLTATLLPGEPGAKVMARLARLGDGLVLWADVIALGPAATPHAIQTIVRRIIGSILPAVDEQTYGDLPPDSHDLYDRYLRAKRQSFSAADHEEARAAAAALEQIVAERPDFAPAYPPLVRLYNTDFAYTELGSTGKAERLRALKLAKAGLAIDRGDAHSHSVLGFCYLWHGRLQLARECFDRVLQLNPYNHVRLQEAATAAMYMEDFARAHALMERAAEMTPIPDDSYYEDLGRLRLMSGDHDGAAETLDAVLHGSIWAPLYGALARLSHDRDGAMADFADWRSAVERRWRKGETPDDATILDWIGTHHPIGGETGRRFFALVEAAARGDAPTDRPASMVSMKQV